MKKIIALALATLLSASLMACSTQTDTDEEKETAKVEEKTVEIKQSPDKYTWYIKDYVGKNCAAIGYTSMGGDRMDAYGSAYMQLIYVTPDGGYIDIKSDDAMKEYVVTGQNLDPNTELKLTFQKDENGEEYDSLVDTQTYEEIILNVKKLSDKKTDTRELTKINPSPDKYTRYVADYVGRNLANCGYTALSGNRMDAYGAAYIKLVIVADDGSYIDPEDTETLKNYVVIGQNVAPNTEIKLTFDVDSNGQEYSNIVKTQSLEEIELQVSPVTTDN